MCITIKVKEGRNKKPRYKGFDTYYNSLQKTKY